MKHKIKFLTVLAAGLFSCFVLHTSYLEAARQPAATAQRQAPAANAARAATPPAGAQQPGAPAPSAARAATPQARAAAPAAPAPAQQAPQNMQQVGGGQVSAARAATTNRVITAPGQATVRTQVAMPNMNEACRDAYFGCMDMFCMSDNQDGGSCMCSADYAQFSDRMRQIQANKDEANRIMTIEVERVEAGAMADILFGDGVRRYDAQGNVVGQTAAAPRQETPAERRARQRAAQDARIAEIMNIGFDYDIAPQRSIADMEGRELYDAAHALCVESARSVCTGPNDLTMVTQAYLASIRNDCQGLGRIINDLLRRSEQAIADAQREVRETRLEVHNVQNEFNRGECVIEFTRCMQGPDVCGTDWTRCVNAVAEENMQSPNPASLEMLFGDSLFEISPSVRRMLDSRQHMCERVLDRCMANRHFIFEDFIRNVAPDLRLAERLAESNLRQSCLGNISDCIMNACAENIGGGRDPANIDACLAHPEMVRSMCMHQLTPCERMEPLIWEYVVARLAALRVDACTREVHACYTHPQRCGPDFTQCIGMDLAALHRMCPVDTLVVCRQGRPDFRIQDLDQMLMGFFMNIDNAMLEACQQLVDERMMEVCGSLTDCNRFASNEQLGTGSLQSHRIGANHVIFGLLSLGMLDMGTGFDANGNPDGSAGRINIDRYLAWLRENNRTDPATRDQVIALIEAELKNIEGNINRTIDLISQDTEIGWCVHGRDLSQITLGDTDRRGRRISQNMTDARFPNMLNSVKMQIAASAIRQAQENYNRQFTEYVQAAMHNASADMKQFFCQRIAAGGAGPGIPQPSTAMVQPWALAYVIGGGIDQATLTGQQTVREYARAGMGVGQGAAANDTGSRVGAGVAGAGLTGAAIAATILTGGIAAPIIAMGAIGAGTAGGMFGNAAPPVVSNIPGGTMETSALFNRDTGVCTITRVSRTQECREESRGGVRVFGLFSTGGRSERHCEPEQTTVRTQEIQM